MIAVLVLVVAATAGLVGLLVGYVTALTRTKDALKLARYRDAIALADDLIKTPDALDLRERAQKLLAAHRAAHKES
jgi:hypothetical protein